VKGRKRHIVVDTQGWLLAVVAHPANIQNRVGAQLVLGQLLGLCPRLQRIWADGAYAGKLVRWAKRVGGWHLELVHHPAQQHTFSGTAATLGSRAHLRLAGASATPEQGL